MSETSGAPVQWGTPQDHAACGDAIAAARALGARDALLSLAAEVEAMVGRPQLPDTPDAVFRYGSGLLQGIALMASRRAQEGPGTPLWQEPVSREGQEHSGKSEAVQAAGDAVAAMFPDLGPQTGRKVAAAVLDAARPHLTRAAFYMEGVKAERQRIRELADRNGAVCTGAEGTSCYFSALIGEVPNG